MAELDPHEDERLVALYQEAASMAGAFWGWRHKVILLCGATLGGVLAVASWLYQQELVKVLWAPFVVGAIIVTGCAVFDRRNAEILDDCFDVAEALEARLLGRESLPLRGPFAKLKQSHTINLDRMSARKWTYTWTLRRGYFGIAVALFAGFAVLLGYAIGSPASLRHGSSADHRPAPRVLYGGPARQP
jgi:hypothetical protein